jgi:signal transduction histidine kinase
MVILRQNQTYSIRFLLYLEWIVLGTITLSEIIPGSLLFGLPRLPLLNLFCLVLLGIMGLKLPSERVHKVFYTSLEFGLVILASVVGGIRLVPLLCIILVTRNCLIFEGLSRSVVTGLVVILCLLTQIYRLRNITIVQLGVIREQLGILLAGSVFLLALSAIFVQLMVNALLQERHSRQELAHSNIQLATVNTQLREYALRVEDLATVQERNRIARDIHDSVGHALTVLNLNLEAALKLWQSDPAEATEFLTEAKLLGSHALQEVRSSIATLRTDPLQGRSLQDAITSLIEDFHRSTSISPIYQLDFQLLQIPSEVKTAVYRILQETLTNICKHALATEVSIQVYGKTSLYVVVEDNGRGFDLSENTTGFGLQGMRDRTLALGGNFDVKSRKGSGCKIVAEFPLSKA